MQKIRIEGYSKESMEAALADAREKASVYISEQFDVSIQLLELTLMPGRGYKAVLEVTIIPMGEKDRFKVKPRDVDVRDTKTRNSRASDKAHEKNLKQLISDHFAYTVGDFLPDIPDYILSDMNQIRLLNYEIEKAFFKATHDLHDIPAAEVGVPGVDKVLGRRPKLDEPEAEPD